MVCALVRNNTINPAAFLMRRSLSSDEPKGETFTFGLDESTDCLRYKGKKYEDLQFSDFNGILFRLVDDVERFYAYHSIAKGFSVRKIKSDKDRDGDIFRRSLCCSKEGWRTVKNPKKCTKVYGSAPSQFDTDHNHVLVPKEMVHFLRSNRMVGEHASAQVSSLKKVFVPTCRAYDLLAHQAGGYEYVGLGLKDLYNQQDSERRELLVDGDAQAAISFMNLKASRDVHFYCYFCVDQVPIFTAIGDVLIMDSTYKTNIYGKPLVVFVGVDNHRATVLFGCSLLVDETEETFKWVVSNFISSMDGKKPFSVITDQDDAMRNAIVEFIPEARYRLCAWHISKNVIGKIHDVNVQRDFSHLIYSGLSVSEWESYWNYVVSMAGLQDNLWVIGMLNKRERWAGYRHVEQARAMG
ncbi:protein FAR1-RELATED SEQUENCE 5-like [Rosa rugosa]|uniref:protein FAR1-RELATED SEQUENCE 5-like n=1 Tax=Rosa rugosa TaxID=74645 RepID=UPI002B405D0E|nr:protein FAR1-RELATED SEQUENCE 5-like [Rosa rugosa]